MREQLYETALTSMTTNLASCGSQEYQNDMLERGTVVSIEYSFLRESVRRHYPVPVGA